MISAKPTALGKWFWRTTGRIGIRRRFKALEFMNPVQVSAENSVILVGNHISWWDGFFAMELNRRLWKKQFYVMMLEEQLRKRPFMRRTGAFSVSPGSRDVVNTIHYTVDLLGNPRNLVLVFPQGKIHSQYDRSFQFKPGLQKIISQTASVQLIFFATFLDYGSNPNPTVRIYTKVIHSREDLANQYAAFFKESEKKHLDAVNE